MNEKPIPIVQEPHSALRSSCLAIQLPEITKPPVQKVITRMKQALLESGDGVAIAAPQIGVTVRMFVVAGFVFDHINNYHGEQKSPDRVFINPVITKASKVKKAMKGEGCLSVRWVYGTTKRSDKVVVRAYDEMGREFTMTGTGLLAQIFQHEIDHLDGVLFIDHAHEVRQMTDQEVVDYQAELQELKNKRMH